MRVLIWVVSIGLVATAALASVRVVRVSRASSSIPVYPGAREAGGRTRYFPRLLSWDDRASARVQRVFAPPGATSFVSLARHANASLASRGWYLVDPDELERIQHPQVIVWQRDPDERLDLSQVWPVSGISREQRLYGGVFPAEFLDAPMVVEWRWGLGGPRTARPSSPSGPSILVAPPPPPPPPSPLD